MFGKRSKAELLNSPEPVDCSWCAAEMNAPTTDSPGICTYHDEMLQQQSADRRAVKYEVHTSTRTVRQDETLGDFLARKLGR